MPFRLELLSEDTELRSPCLLLLGVDELSPASGRWARVAPTREALAAAAKALQEVTQAPEPRDVEPTESSDSEQEGVEGVRLRVRLRREEEKWGAWALKEAWRA